MYTARWSPAVCSCTPPAHPTCSCRPRFPAACPIPRSASRKAHYNINICIYVYTATTDRVRFFGRYIFREQQPHNFMASHFGRCFVGYCYFIKQFLNTSAVSSMHIKVDAHLLPAARCTGRAFFIHVPVSLLEDTKLPWM